MMQPWFLDAKFGIFIHWGIYSTGRTSESWAFFNNEISHADYMAQAKEFTAAKYDPEEWARLFAEAGAKYAVLTSKHHDGFALWDTKLSKLNSVEGAPAGRDLMGPYCEALRRHGLKVGIYFSHLDWSHPDYATVLPKGKQPHNHGNLHKNPFGYPQNGEHPERWERFLEFQRGQLKELCTKYRPDLLWFDGDWERDEEQWRFEELRNLLHSWCPNVILNSRMGKHGDYGTPEQAIPVQKPGGWNATVPWEFCVTMNDSWGYQLKDKNHKTPRQCVRMLAECAGTGGNLLLDVGPKADGSLQVEQVETLREMGTWMKRNAEAIHATEAGLPHGHFYGASTMNKARDVIYLITFDRPIDSVAVKGIRNNVQRASVLGGPELKQRKIGGAPWAHLPGVLWIDVPGEAVDPLATVIKVELEGPLDLYTGAGDAVTFNH
jgi:alpha-L-fucosidase